MRTAELPQQALQMLASEQMRTHHARWHFVSNRWLRYHLLRSLPTSVLAINIPGLIPIDEIAYPQGATHVTVKGCWTRVDFATGISQVFTSNVVNLPINATSTNVTLTPTGTPTGPGTDLFILQLEFFQMVNNVQYVLKNGAHNAMAIVEVA